MQSTEPLIRVGAVSYLNTAPLLYGLEQSALRQRIDLYTDYPSAVANRLLQGSIDVGLVPVAIKPLLPQAFIQSRWCIGAVGPVASVCLFSQVPLQQVQTVLLDYQSRTSVALVQVLMRHYWQKEVQWLPAYPGFENDINGTTAAVVIGDRAFHLHQRCQYAFDLAEAWIAHTGLPFVFAAWISNKALPDEFVAAFDAAQQAGLQQLEEVVKLHPFAGYDLLHYYRHHISYSLDADKRAGMSLFLKLLTETERPFAGSAVATAAFTTNTNETHP
ncbi:MAG: menaquinone biosynthesis protein [Chitinophagaceae bacterium]|nr:menaquinone biosynthesis protein [Chitinophagaceae bacterium]